MGDEKDQETYVFCPSQVSKRLRSLFEDDDNVIRVLMNTPDPYKSVQEVALMFQGMITLEEVHDALYGGNIE